MADESAELGPNARLFPGRTFVSNVIDLLDTKSDMSTRPWKLYMMRAAMAGILISVFYLAFYSIQAKFDELDILPVGVFLGSWVFGFALVFIYFSYSELLTSNMMVGTVGVYYNRRRWPQFVRILVLCYLGNLLGGLFVALVVWGSSLISGGVGEVMHHSVDVKLGYISGGASGMTDLFMRAILCNFMINIAMLVCYNGRVTSEIGKIAVMVPAVFIFAYLGLEHSVANTCLFLLYGVSYGIDVGEAAANVSIALVGNFIGGGLLIGLYYAYANDYRRALRRGYLHSADDEAPDT